MPTTIAISDWSISSFYIQPCSVYDERLYQPRVQSLDSTRLLPIQIKKPRLIPRPLPLITSWITPLDHLLYLLSNQELGLLNRLSITSCTTVRFFLFFFASFISDCFRASCYSYAIAILLYHYIDNLTLIHEPASTFLHQ